MSIQTVGIEQIRTSPAALREVQDSSEEFLGLVESIRNRGFVGSISARPARDPETNEVIEGEYELIDGLQRYSAAKRVGLEEIALDIIDLNDGEVLEAQIMMNVHRVETKPREYAAQLLRIMGLNPTWTIAELADKLGKSTAWLNKMLRLNKIDNEQINDLINEGKIPLSNAYALAKLPPEEQAAWVEDAQIDPNGVFIPKIEARVKEIREERRKGREASAPTFSPVEHMRKMKEIREEIESGESLAAILGSPDVDASTPADVARVTLQWVLNVDPLSVEAQRAEWQQKQDEKAERKRLKEEEKKRKKAAEARAEADKIEAELGGETAEAIDE